MGKDTKDAVQLTPEELARVEQMKKDGTEDLQAVMIGYAKRMAGYPYISASRIERLPEKGQKASVLFDQMSINYLLKNSKNPDAAKDFMEVFGNGKVIFIQAHAKCPTVGIDGLYDQRTPDGEHIKSQVMGYFAIKEEEPAQTDDEYAVKDYSYFYKDPNNGEWVDLGVNMNVPLKEYYAKYNTVYKRPTIPLFEPMIIVKTQTGFGRILGNPYHMVTTQEVAAVLKEQEKRQDQQ